jgi:hypothetical protein
MNISPINNDTLRNIIFLRYIYKSIRDYCPANYSKNTKPADALINYKVGHHKEATSHKRKAAPALLKEI